MGIKRFYHQDAKPQRSERLLSIFVAIFALFLISREGGCPLGPKDKKIFFRVSSRNPSTTLRAGFAGNAKVVFVSLRLDG